MSNPTTANYDNFSLVQGGLIYNATSILRKSSKHNNELTRTAFVLVLITWVGLYVSTLFEGNIKDTELTISFFEDFLVHVRYLFVVPFLILIENVVDKAFIGYVQNADRLISNTDQERYNRLIKTLNSLTDSILPEIIILIGTYAYIIFQWQDLSIFSSGRNYLVIDDKLNIAGWYFLLVCTPIFQLLVFRWLWRWAVWIYSIISISRFKLQTDPLHADKMAGLEFLNIVPLALSYILIAPSAIFAAHIGIDIIYKGANLLDFVMPIGAYVFLLPVILFAPLLLFIPHLMKTKIYGIQDFGNIIRSHNKSYREVWIEHTKSKNEQLLGTMDNSSLADINGSYGPVQGQQLFPINLRILFMSFVMNLLPYFPLIFTYYTPSQLFQDLLKSIIT